MLYTHIAQLMTHATYVYIATAYLAIMLLSLLAYCRDQLRGKWYTYIICTEQRSIPFLSENFVAKFSEFFKFLSFQFLWKANYLKNSDHTNVVFLKEIFFLCPYEEMFSHFKLLTETFPYFVRRFYILILTF